ncbi:MAG: PspC domain-containing protein [Calditrichaeota bacterium]|nr:MAG: PspC domain-containing protein [Calditrichota bacterium]
MKKLYRSRRDKKLGGLIGGLAEYLEVDSNLLRLLTILVAFFTGFAPVVLTYVIGWLIVPEEPELADEPQPVKSS